MAFEFKPTGKELDRDILAEGSYPCLIVNIDDCETKAGTGHYIKLELMIIDGDAKNYKITDYINYQNANATAQSIGLKTLAKISKAIFNEIKEFSLDEINQKFVTIKTKNKLDNQGNMRPNIVDYSTYELPF